MMNIVYIVSLEVSLGFSRVLEAERPRWAAAPRHRHPHRHTRPLGAVGSSALFGGGRDAGMGHAAPLPGRPARLWHPAWVPSPSDHPSTPTLVGTTSRLPPPRGPPSG